MLRCDIPWTELAVRTTVLRVARVEAARKRVPMVKVLGIIVR